MTTIDPQTAAKMRQGFKYFNKFMLLMWRLGLGKWVNFWPEVGGQIMVLTHTGRKTGLKRQTPVNYALVEGELYCTAGFGQLADWYRNIMAEPRVEVWLPDGWWTGLAEEVTDARTGPDGPGDLAWVWPLATLVLLWLLVRGCRRGCKRWR